MDLEPVEQRILGSLLEKQVTVPASYPLTLSSLRTACNQTSSREPVMELDERTVEQTARALKDRGLLRIVWSDTGRRTLKYHQTLSESLDLADDERAVLTVLLLRGPQAPGELRTRTERLHPFADRAEVEACLERMAGATSRWCSSWSDGQASRTTDGCTCWARSRRGRHPRRRRSTVRLPSPTRPRRATPGCARRTASWRPATRASCPTSSTDCRSSAGCSTGSRWLPVICRSSMPAAGRGT